jgi:hypothetical protein
MKTMFLALIAPIVGLVISRLAETKVNTAPRYRPDPDENLGYIPLDPNHNDWQRLDAVRDEAVRLGLDSDRLVELELGYCPDQVRYQIEDLQDWINQHEQSAAA